MFILMGVFFQIKSPALRDDISPGKNVTVRLFNKSSYPIWLRVVRTLRVVQPQAILLLKSMSERVGSDIERL